MILYPVAEYAYILRFKEKGEGRVFEEKKRNNNSYNTYIEIAIFLANNKYWRKKFKLDHIINDEK